MNDTRLYAVRGAVCCENNQGSIERFIPLLYRTIIEENSIQERDIVSVMFTVTPDLTALNPAAALRRAGLGETVALFCAAEPIIDGGLPYVTRVLITYYGHERPRHAYLNGAEVLRPDLAGKSPRANG